MPSNLSDFENDTGYLTEAEVEEVVRRQIEEVNPDMEWSDDTL